MNSSNDCEEFVKRIVSILKRSFLSERVTGPTASPEYVAAMGFRRQNHWPVSRLRRCIKNVTMLLTCYLIHFQPIANNLRHHFLEAIKIHWFLHITIDVQLHDRH